MDISPFGKVIAIILTAALIFLFPLPYLAKAVSETVDDLVNTYVAEFSDTARQQGSITKEMYEKMIRSLDRTGELYDINLEVSHPVSGTEIAKLELGDQFPDRELVKTAYNEKASLERGLVEEYDQEEEIKSIDTHMHADDCYAGHRHNSCIYSYSVPAEGVSATILKGDILRYTYLRLTDTQSTPYRHTELRHDYIINVFSVKEYVASAVNYYVEFHLGEQLYYKNLNQLYTAIQWIDAGSQDNTQIDRERSLYIYPGWLPTLSFSSCALTQDETPICNQIVTSIAATKPEQAVSAREEFISTANATYLDNHTGVVNCSNNLNINVIGDQNVTLTYSGLVGNAKSSGTRTCTVNTTVKGGIELTDITVSPLNQELTRYQNPTFIVTANYSNNTSKQVTGFTINDFNNTLLGTQSVTLSYKEADITKTATANITVKNLTTTCVNCNTVYYLDENDIDQGCPNCNSTVISITANPAYVVLHQGDPLDITVEGEYANGKRSIITDWTSNYDPIQVGIQDVTITYQTFTAVISVDVRYALITCSICSLKYELYMDGTDPGCPVCNSTVVSIKAAPEELTIEKYQSLPITVTATYKDGHTEIINDWASNLLSDTAGIYEVMILYQNAIDIIKVTVLEEGQIECQFCGLKYIFNDSPKGCPSCYVTLTGIEAALRSGGTTVPYKSKLNLQITKIFKDEHQELTYTGWTVSDYDPGRLGSQTITVYYGGFQDQLDIEVIDDLPEVTCPNGHTYYLDADGSDPGCPYCNTTEGRAEGLIYFDTTYTRFILDQIYNHGAYPLEKGDYLRITIKPRKISILSRLLNLFDGLANSEYTFGGEVS